MDMDFWDDFELHSSENKHLGIVVPQYSTDLIWSNLSVSWTNAVNLEWWSGMQLNTESKELI